MRPDTGIYSKLKANPKARTLVVDQFYAEAQSPSVKKKVEDRDANLKSNEQFARPGGSPDEAEPKATEEFKTPPAPKTPPLKKPPAPKTAPPKTPPSKEVVPFVDTKMDEDIPSDALAPFVETQMEEDPPADVQARALEGQLARMKD
jgi:hypothetical protein